MIAGRIDRGFPRLAFARRIPLRNIAVRVLRRFQERSGAIARVRPGSAALVDPALLPAPVFAPRAIAAGHDQNGWRFEFLGTARTFPGAIDWHPRDPALGQLWRMNLHYMEYLEVLPPAAALAAIRSWIAANPPGRADARQAAWNGYALSLRTVCWMQWLARCGADLDPRAYAEIGASLALQLAVLERFPETDLGGNHLIKNIKALLWGSAALRGEASASWGKLGRELLRKELGCQVLADGIHYERSPSYHSQVAADLIECAAVMDAGERARLAPTIATMVAGAQALSHPDGAAAQFNDAGLSMAYPPAMLAVASGSPPSGEGARVFPDAGFASLRTAGFSAIVKFGPIGADSLPAHAHGDIGSFELSWGARRVIVDQGVFEYVEGARREASRAASSHNLTAPADGDMADFFGAFRCGWRPHPITRLALATEGRIEVAVTHDGFAHARVAHCNIVERSLVATAETVIITDRLSHGAGAGWASRFLLHPDWACRAHPDGVELECGEQRLVLRSGVAARIEDAVWWPDMGREIATRRIVIAWPDGLQELSMVFTAL